MSKKLEEFLANEEIYLNDEQIEAVKRIVRQNDAHRANKGYFLSRLEHNPREKSFSETWLKENEPIAGFNYGNGILQDLFIEGSGLNVFGGNKTIEFISDRDRMIVATVIQWLGSNVGMAFLSKALEGCDYYIKQKEKLTKPNK